MKFRNYDKVEKLFQRCLIKILHIELWRCYLNYVKVRVNLLHIKAKNESVFDFFILTLNLTFYFTFISFFDILIYLYIYSLLILFYVNLRKPKERSLLFEKRWLKPMILL